MEQPLWKTVWRFFKKKKLELYNPAVLFLGVYLKMMKVRIQKDTCTPVFIVAVFTIARTWQQPKCPSTEERIKMWSIYTTEAPLSMGFSRQEYWSGLPFPSPGDLPGPGIEPRSPTL